MGDNDDDVGTVGTLTTTEAGEISEDDDDKDEDCVPCYEDEADVAREDAAHEAHMQQHFEKNRQKHGDGEPEMGAVDDAEDDDAPHFHFLKNAGIEAADSGKIRAVLAECWRALSVNVSDGNNKKKPRTTEFIHHNTSTKGALLLVPETKHDDPIAGDNRFKAEERASNPKVEERRERNARVARTRTRTEAVKAETDDKRQQMIMMATDGDEDVEMGAGHV